jgi:lipid A 4'-phosphatase
MNRTGLVCVLAIAIMAGMLFGLYPELDLDIVRHFHAVETKTTNHEVFALRLYPALIRARRFGLWFPALLVTPAVGALVIKLMLPWRKLVMPGRAVVFLIATMILAPGIMANVALKEHWGRPRPIDVTQFGGNEHFVPWWDRHGDCPANCSFVSGDVAAGFWTLAPAALAPPQWRALAYGAAFALGMGMAALRMMTGGHFPSDVIFAGVFTYLIIWIVYALIYRWPRTRLSDDDVDRSLSRLTLPAYDFVAGLFGRKPK